MKDHARYFMVSPEEISYVGFVVHAYEGLAVVRTLDGQLGLIEMLVAPDLEEELDGLLGELTREVGLREITAEEAASLGSFDGSA